MVNVVLPDIKLCPHRSSVLAQGVAGRLAHGGGQDEQSSQQDWQGFACSVLLDTVTRSVEVRSALAQCSQAAHQRRR